MLVNDTRLPVGSVVDFGDELAVQSYFGAGSYKAAEAGIYFGAFEGATIQPAALLAAQYNETPVAAYLRGGNAGTLASLQALSGSLTVAIDGYSHVIASIALSSYNSFSAIAAALQSNFTDPTEASFTASIGSSSTTCTSSSTTLTLGALASGYLSPGDLISGTDSTNTLPAGCHIVAQLTGTPGGSAGATFSISAAATPGNLTSCTVTGTSTVLDVTVDTDHAIAVGQTLVGISVTGSPVITAQISGTPGGVGLYRISGAAQGVASESMTALATAPLVTYDSVSSGFVITSGITGTPSTAAFATGTLAAPLFLTAATGAILSQGAAAASPASFMNALIVQNSTWVNFMTLFDPDQAAFIGSVSGTTLTVVSVSTGTIAIGQTLTGTGVVAGTTITAGSGLSWTVSVSQSISQEALFGLTAGGNGNTVKQAFAAWKNAQNNRYGYFCWDGDASPGASSDAASSLGQVLKGNGDSGTLLIWEGGSSQDNGLCAFALGIGASINYEQTNGRTDFAFRAQAGLTANVTDPTTAGNLIANGYCFYGAYGSANANYIWFQNGQITGPFTWADSYQTQIWLNSFFQAQLLTLFQNSLSVPFTIAGIGLIQQTCQTVIQAGLLFGAFAPNTLTAGQIADVNAAAGGNIAGSLQSQGYYLQVNLPSQIVQAARGPWDITFFYIDRNSVQSLNLASVLVQ